MQQWRFDANVSVVDTLLSELRGRAGMLATDDGLPYDFPTLLTAAGLAYAEAPENLERYWATHRRTFQPAPFEGTFWTRAGAGAGADAEAEAETETVFRVQVQAPSVTVIAATLQPAASR